MFVTMPLESLILAAIIAGVAGVLIGAIGVGGVSRVMAGRGRMMVGQRPRLKTLTLCDCALAHRHATLR